MHMKIILVAKEMTRLVEMPLSSFLMIIVVVALMITGFLSLGTSGVGKSWNDLHTQIKESFINGLSEKDKTLDDKDNKETKKQSSVNISIYFDIITYLAIFYAVFQLLIILKAYFILLFKPWNNRPSGLIIKKFYNELESFSLDSTSSFTDKNQQGQLIENELKIFSLYLKKKNSFIHKLNKDKETFLFKIKKNEYTQKLNALHINKKIWRSDWCYWETPRLSEIRRYSTDENAVRMERINNLESLIVLCEYAETQNCKLKFYVANIQPSVIIAVERIAKVVDPAKNYIEIITETHTGPHTISEAVKAKKEHPKTSLKSIKAMITGEKERTEIICFVAPMAAFCTYQHNQFASMGENNNVDPNDYFVSVTTVIEEDQEILFVEDYTRTPYKKPRIYYYNNSTSEECIAKLDKIVWDQYDLCEINDFDTYRHLLSETYTEGRSLEPGDGIALWAPLIEKFIDKKVATGILRPHSQRPLFKKVSMINIYADKEVIEKGSEVVRQFHLTFIRAIILEMRCLQLEYIYSCWGYCGWVKKRFSWSKWPWSELYLLKKSHLNSFKRSIGQ